MRESPFRYCRYHEYRYYCCAARERMVMPECSHKQLTLLLAVREKNRIKSMHYVSVPRHSSPRHCTMWWCGLHLSPVTIFGMDTYVAKVRTGFPPQSCAKHHTTGMPTAFRSSAVFVFYCFPCHLSAFHRNSPK